MQRKLVSLTLRPSVLEIRVAGVDCHIAKSEASVFTIFSLRWNRIQISILTESLNALYQ